MCFSLKCNGAGFSLSDEQLPLSLIYGREEIPLMVSLRGANDWKHKGNK